MASLQTSKSKKGAERGVFYYINQYLKRKPYHSLFENWFETEKISVMGGSRWVLVKAVLFHLRGIGHP